MPDTMLHLQLLRTMTLMYIGEQLEHAGMFLHAAWRSAVEADADGSWDTLAVIHSFRFRIGREGWLQFAQELGVDADYLVRENHQGSLLDLCEDNICQIAPGAEMIQAVLKEAGHGAISLEMGPFSRALSPSGEGVSTRRR